MARQTITKSALTGPNPTGLVSVTVTACDATNKEQTAHTGKEILCWRNTGAGARTVTVNTVTDERGRTGDLTAISIPAGAIRCIGPMTDVQGWRQTTGYINSEAEHAEVTMFVLTLP